MQRQTHNPTNQYHVLLDEILDNGIHCENRTGIDTLSVFGRVMRFDISGGKVPLLHSKKVFTKAIIHELIWMLSGDTNIRYLKQHGVNIWDSWVKKGTEEYAFLTLEERYALYLVKHKKEVAAYWESVGRSPDESLLQTYPPHMGPIKFEHVCDSTMDVMRVPKTRLVAGELPKIYQHQWRRWESTKTVENDSPLVDYYLDKGYSVWTEAYQPDDSLTYAIMKKKYDQIQMLVDKLKNNPDDRRIILSAWNVAEIEEMALPPCHILLHLKPYKLALVERIVISETRNIPLEEVPTYRLSGLLYQR